MVRRSRSWLILASVLGLWLIVGLIVAPSLLEWIYQLGAIPALAQRPLSYYLEEWRAIVLYGAAAAIAVTFFVRALHDPTIARSLVPDARPSDLGAIRMLVAGVLLVSTLWEDLSSTAVLPRELMDPLGVMQLLALLPAYESIATSVVALDLLKWLTALALVFAAIGWKTRIFVPIGAVLYLIVGGWLRQYAWFYHTGLIPFYLLAVLAFLPAGHGLSIDRLLRHRRGDESAPHESSRRFGWARYAVWTALALPYVAAGLSKLRNGGFLWWDASNFKFILFQSTLRPMAFDFELSLGLASAPDWLFAAMAITAVLSELLYGLVLFSRRARSIIPIGMMTMHVGILLFQNILFFDLILLQLIFLNFRPLLHTLSRRLSVIRFYLARAGLIGESVKSPLSTFPVEPTPSGRRPIVAVVILVTACWVFRVEFYPFTGMQMFSSKRTEPVTYERVLAYTSSGHVMRAPIEESIGAMSDSRYRRVLGMAFDAHRAPTSRAFMAAVVDRWNRSAAADRVIRRIEIQQWEWYYLAEPADPNYGRLVNRVVYSFEDETKGW